MQEFPPIVRIPESVRTGQESTALLLVHARGGDRRAANELLRRYLPRLSAWAHGRLPARGRDLLDTKDLVQVTLIRAFNRLEAFEPRREGAFLAYLRQILFNEIRQSLRRAVRRPSHQSLPDDLQDAGPSPLETVLGLEKLAAYEAGLMKLTEEQREAVLLRVEMGFSYLEIADAIESPSPNAARMLVVRGLARLAELMDERP